MLFYIMRCVYSLFLIHIYFQVDEIFNVPGTGPVVGGTLER